MKNEEKDKEERKKIPHQPTTATKNKFKELADDILYSTSNHFW